jgi:hypothetical protein
MVVAASGRREGAVEISSGGIRAMGQVAGRGGRSGEGRAIYFGRAKVPSPLPMKNTADAVAVCEVVQNRARR